jgi:D-alanyl-D-alanine carboxypeptidase/D-alanyl-D-alanine-endopeptidase (penicillin-binding protein 4)
MARRLEILMVLWVLVLGGCTTVAPPGRTLSPTERLRNAIDAVLSDSIFIPSRASVKVVSLNTNEVLYDRDSRQLMRPASNMKLLTSATALHTLGRTYQFKTCVFSDSITAAGIVRGNLYLKGYGDPDLRISDLDSAALYLRSMGISQVWGDIVGDNSYFDDLEWGNGWMWDDEPDPDEMFISALSVNKNCVSVTVSPTPAPSDSVLASCDPPTPFITIQKRAKTVRDSATVPLHISRLFMERLNTVTVSGEVQVGGGIRQRRVSVWRPELFAAQILKESLQRNGIYVFGQPRFGITPETARKVWEKDWPLESVILAMNKVSDNLSAENLLKTIGAQERGLPGSARNGIYVVNSFLASCGLDTTGHSIADGSGVSHYNLVTGDEVLRLLTVVARSPEIFPVLYASLPIAGVDGTLENRMIGTAAAGNLRAKTGTLSGVSSLSGYVTTRDGELLVFSMMMQNFVIPTRYYHSAQDRIGALLAQFSRKSSAAASR